MMGEMYYENFSAPDACSHVAAAMHSFGPMREQARW